MASDVFVARTPNLVTASSRGLPIASVELAGKKAGGLLRLPHEWYLPGLVFTPALHVACDGDHENIETLLRGASMFDSVQRVLAELAGDPEARLLVRSNAGAESIADRGSLLSVLASSDWESLKSAIARVWSDARRTDPDMDVGLLIQRELWVEQRGHLSNEHRVSRESVQWTCTIGGEPVRWRVSRSVSPSTGDAFLARNPAMLEQKLRSAARHLTDAPRRMHLEWVWDGARVYLVQADEVAPVLGPSPGEAFRPTPGTAVDSEALLHWKALDFDHAGDLLDWRKVASIEEFERAGLSTARFWTISGGQVRDAMLRDAEGLRRDVQSLCSGHLLVRSDVRGGMRTNTPKSGATLDPDEVLKYLQDALNELCDEYGADDVLFIAHRYLRARSSAWAVAWPDQPQVLVDSTWGLADGLSWLPHDSSWVDPATGDIRRTRRAGKASMLDIDPSDHWRQRDTPSEWVWKDSASSDQLQTIAFGTKALAAQVGSRVDVMWFVGMLDGHDTDCLAWVRPPAPDDGLPSRIPKLRRIVIKRLGDLEHVVESCRGEAMMVLEPIDDHVRDGEFLRVIAERSASTGVPIVLQGSPLAHAFYQLKKFGADVSCAYSGAPAPVVHNKLVRDRIPEIVERNGESAATYEASQAELAVLLKQKLVEEALEVAASSTPGSTVEELADVEEILASLRNALGVTAADVAEVQRQKREKRGGFMESTVLLSTRSVTPEPESQLGFFNPDTYRRVGTEKLEFQRSGVKVPMARLLTERVTEHVIETDAGNVAIRISADSIEVNVSSLDRPTEQPTLPF